MNAKTVFRVVGAIAVLAVMGGCAREGTKTAQSIETITLDTTVLFDFDKAEIRNDARPILDDVAEKIRTHVNTFVILEGHTDRRGSEEYNEILAEKRARAVGSYLSQRGVGFRHMTFVSLGKRELKDIGNSEGAHQNNRRVEIHNTANTNEELDRGGDHEETGGFGGDGPGDSVGQSGDGGIAKDD